jgi:sugar lactone lactonase YvrE
MRAVRITIAIAAIVTAASLFAVAPAGAHGSGKGPAPAPSPTVLTTAVGVPFNLEVRNGNVLVADGGAELIGKVKADGTVKTLIDGVPGAAGLATSRDGRYFAYTTTVGGQEGITASGVTITGPKGFTAAADTLAFETAKNPDGRLHYGVKNPSECVAKALEGVGIPVSYTGAIDSHAYSLTAYGKGFVLADAGANALLRVSRTGKVSTLAVLPPHPAKITAEAAAAFGLDDCVVGVTYNFESVPTDVEVGHDGFLYVTTLPGGPEDASLGARGKVFRVNPFTGKAKEIASGLLGATNLAISDGKIYVTELFAGRVSLIKHKKVSAWLDLPGALSIEAGKRGTLYAGTGVTGPGSVVRIDTGKGWRH